MGEFLVGLPTQRVPSCVRLAAGGLSFSAVPAAGCRFSTYLSADTASPADDHHALANGSVRGITDAQALIRSQCDASRGVLMAAVFARV